jgi:acyl-CoA hydrolase
MEEDQQDYPGLVAPEIQMADLVLPNQTNYYRTMFGGDAMAMMDKAAAIATLLFCRQPIVTASTEHIDFRQPVHEGDIIEALARVIYVSRSMLVVRVHIYGENPMQNNRKLCTTGHFSLVAVTPEGKAMPVKTKLLLEDEQAREEWEVGRKIHEVIQARRKR